MIEKYFIHLKNVSLIYDLYHDRTNNLKEYVINLIRRKKYVPKKTENFYALKDFSLSIHDGERLGVIGLNGSGKSTLLKVISRILKPSEGDLEISGDVQPLIEIGAGFDPEFSGRENIYLNGYMLGFSKKQIQEKEKQIIEFCELGHFIDVPVKYYSSGMSIRLAFTIATSIHPEILLIDEMLAAGDAQFIDKAKKRIDELLNIARILVVVSHDLKFIRDTCLRTIVLHKGRIVFDGKTDEAFVFYNEIVNTPLC